LGVREPSYAADRKLVDHPAEQLYGKKIVEHYVGIRARVCVLCVKASTKCGTRLAIESDAIALHLGVESSHGPIPQNTISSNSSRGWSC
jgi:hypothetical protein